MTSIPTATSMPWRRIAAAAIACLLLSIAATAAISPGTASAATTCASGDFCMWWGVNETGGLYASPTLDLNLIDNHFANLETTATVSANTESFYNHGGSDPKGLVDVIVFSVTGATGPAHDGLCIRQNQRANLPAAWMNQIKSFRWATHTACNLYPRAV
jgi:hypothetical protein